MVLNYDVDPDILEMNVRVYYDELVLGLVDLLIKGKIKTEEMYGICKSADLKFETFKR